MYRKFSRQNVGKYSSPMEHLGKGPVVGGVFDDVPPFIPEVFLWYTPPKINIEPENDGLEDVSPFPGVYSQVPC